MAFTYSGDPASSMLDYLRFILGDTNEAAPILQDAELQYIIDTSASGTQCLALSFRAAANTLGARLVKRTLGPQSEDATERHRYFVSQAKQYEKYLSLSGPPAQPNYQAELIFQKGMMSNEV